jgi:hypothetical protein
LRKKLIDAARGLSKSALSLQVRPSRRDPIALGIENRHPITVVAFVVKCKLVSVIAMCAGCHRDDHLRAEYQVGLGEGTIFRNENWVASKSFGNKSWPCPLYPDITERDCHVRFVPKADISALFDYFIGA